LKSEDDWNEQPGSGWRGEEGKEGVKGRKYE